MGVISNTQKETPRRTLLHQFVTLLLLLEQFPANSLPILPEFKCAFDVIFTWGSMDLQSFCLVRSIPTRKLRSNSFRIPNGNIVKHFVLELARLFRAAGEVSILECIALKATFTLCA